MMMIVMMIMMMEMNHDETTVLVSNIRKWVTVRPPCARCKRNGQEEVR